MPECQRYWLGSGRTRASRPFRSEIHDTRQFRSSRPFLQKSPGSQAVCFYFGLGNVGRSTPVNVLVDACHCREVRVKRKKVQSNATLQPAAVEKIAEL